MKPEDFEELLANCADEPIRFPGAIQPHGVLLTLSEPDLNIIQVSTNVASLFNRAPESLLGQPLHTLIGAEHAQAVQAMAEHNSFLDAPPLHVTLKRRRVRRPVAPPSGRAGAGIRTTAQRTSDRGP